jgi:iron complex transport system substrate-binding protein
MKKVIAMLSSILLALSVVGCSSTKKSSTSSTDQYPLTLTHAFGTTTIKKEPKRVAAIGWENGDTPLALGIVPVGVSRSNYGAETKNHLHVWADQAFKKLGENNPVVFDDTDGWDYEAIAKTKPDVIIASYSGMTKEEYETLSKIAPVLPYKKNAWQTIWRDQTIENATALGKKKEGEELVKKTETLIKEKLSSYPDLKGKKSAFMWFSAEDLSKFYVYTLKDPRAAYLQDLSLEVPESIKSIDSKDFSLTVSREKASTFKDVELIVTYGDEALLKKMQSDPLLSQIPAIKNGAVVLLSSDSELAAGTTPSILSIPHNLDNYLKVINEAAKKA